MEKTTRITLTKAQLDAMSRDDLSTLLLRAQRIEATAVVRDVHGNIKYDDPTLAGTYNEEHLTHD
jgi:hypothetical protein